LDDLLMPFGVDIDLETGEMRDAERITVRNASSMRGHYADAQALESLIARDNDPLHYKVFEKPVPETRGNLMFCISKLQPGLVGREYFMTKGHYHSVADTAEIYLCLAGEGLMLMKTLEGECVAEPMIRGKMVYVPPFWAHRSVNTGRTPLISFCVYPAKAGHNYGDIEKQGFPKRVVQEDGKAVLV
jgi:glucose-6-phosphate isomerase, archaeal